jgi:hypothetical protein
LVISDVDNVLVENNVIAHINTRTTFDQIGKPVMDKECGICTCTYNDFKKEKCKRT